jgi:hypothetical protein
LEVVFYSLKPPGIHRDINPKNIILDKAEMLFYPCRRGHRVSLSGDGSAAAAGAMEINPFVPNCTGEVYLHKVVYAH